MRIIESRSIDNQAGLLGSRLITGTNVIEGAFQSFIVAEDTVVTKVYNSIGIDVTGRLGLTSITLKAGAFISMPKGDYFSSIKLASGSIVAYFTSHGGMSISADAYLSEFLSRTGSSYLEASECVKAHLQQLINAGLLQKASLIMSPSMYEEDLVKSVVPQDGSGDLSFTRASDGTRINSAGLVEVCPWNLFGYSEEFTNAYWNKSASTITANVVTAPNGTTTADQINESVLSTPHGVFPSSGSDIVVGQSYTASMYVKKGNRSYCGLEAFYNGTNGAIAFFNLDNGTLLYQFAQGSGYSITNSSITNVGNDWYLLRGTFTFGATPAFVGVCMASTQWTTGTSYNNTYAGDTSKFMYIWGAQLNIGSTAKPYFPTTDRLNVPRLTYQNGGGGCPSLLLEPQRTNIFPNSQTTANWSFTNMSRTANYGISPDGTQNADLLSPTTSGSVTFQSDITTSSLVIGQPFVVSFFIKLNASFTSDAGTNILDIRLSGPTVWSRPTVRVNLETGEVTSINNAIYISSTNFGNGWFRITFGATPTGTSGQVALQSPTSVTMNGGSFYIWGLQGEANATYATSYIQTQASSATRVADACSKTGISSLIGQTEGAFMIDVDLKSRLSYTYFLINNSTSNYIGIQFNTTTIQLEVVNAGVLQSAITLSNSATGRFKIAGAYANNDFVLYINGTQVGTGTSGSVPATNQVDLYYNATNTIQYNEVVLFKTRLINAELQALTA
jgi:hypothetical protein